MAKSFQVDTEGTLMTSLASYYTWDNNWNDSIGSANWTINGAATTTWKINWWYSFNGITNYITASLSWSWYSWISIWWWFKNTSTGSVWHDMWTIILNNSMGFGWWWWDDFYLYRSGTKDYVGSVTRGVFKHIIAVYAANSRKLYIDGTLFFSDTNNVSLTLWTIEWGRGNFPSVTYFPWVIDEQFVYTKALNTTEISNLYNGWTGNALIDSNLSWFYKFF